MGNGSGVIAYLVGGFLVAVREQRNHNPRVAGSSPAAAIDLRRFGMLACTPACTSPPILPSRKALSVHHRSNEEFRREPTGTRRQVFRMVVGHRHASVTEAVYIERDGTRAAKVMQEMG